MYSQLEQSAAIFSLSETAVVVKDYAIKAVSNFIHNISLTSPCQKRKVNVICLTCQIINKEKAAPYEAVKKVFQ